MSSVPLRGDECSREWRAETNLLQLLVSPASANLDLHDGRCSHRYGTVKEAWDACLHNALCAGFVRDRGLDCANRGKLLFELRGGTAVPSHSTTAWVCPTRLARAVQGQVIRGAPNVGEGFSFVQLGGCARPGYACKYVRELREALGSVRQLGRWPTAVLCDGSVPTAWLSRDLGADIVRPLLLNSSSASESSDYGLDQRARKLLAYGQSPFERTVFLDSDTYVLGPSVHRLFRALDRFDLLAAFECCRTSLKMNGHFDRMDPMYGWEMQMGVLAYRRNARVEAFWSESRRIYRASPQKWARFSSGEQGAATLALSTVDVRFMPLPPNYNARPFTMHEWLKIGINIYHGKELYTHKGLNGDASEPGEMAAERMRRDWSRAAQMLERPSKGAPTLMQRLRLRG